jgi:hypothetical protein
MRRIATLALLAAAVCTACGGEPAGTEYPTSPAVPLLAELVGVWDMDMHVVSRRGCGFADGGCEADTVSYMVLGGLAFVGGPVDSSRWYGADAVATVTATLVLDGKQWRDPDATCSGRGTGCYSQRLTARRLSVDTTVALTVWGGADDAQYRIIFSVRSSGRHVASISADWNSPVVRPRRFQGITDWYFLDLWKR